MITRVTVALLAVLLMASAQARPPLAVKSAVFRAENTNPRGQTLVLPYAFNSESTQLVFGVGGMRKGFYQDQMTVAGLGFVGEESHAVFGGVWDFRVPSTVVPPCTKIAT